MCLLRTNLSQIFEVRWAVMSAMTLSPSLKKLATNTGDSEEP